jgi:hypothetical protein
LKVIDYNLISATDQETLVNQTRLLIAQGWQPQGGIAAIQETDICECEFFQALVMCQPEVLFREEPIGIYGKLLLDNGLCEITGPERPIEVN